MMSVKIYDVFMEGGPKELEKIKKPIKLRFNIQELWKVNKFLRVYYEQDHDTKGPYTKKICIKT